MRDILGRGVLVVCILAFFTVMMGRIIVSPVVPAITDTFAITNATMGIALSIMWGMYALAQFPSGVLGDSYGERIVILGSLTLITVSIVLLVLAPSFALFVVGLVVLGASCGLYYTVATALIAKLYTDTGRAIGIHAGGGQVAGIVGPVVISWIAVRYGWRLGISVGVLISIPVLVIAIRVLPRTSPSSSDGLLVRRFTPSNVADSLTRPVIAYLTVIAGLGWFGFQAMLSFLPTFLVEFHGLSVGAAGVLFSVFFASIGVSMVVVGGVSDRFSRRGSLLAVFAVGAASVGVLIVANSVASIVVGVVLLGVGMSWMPPMEAWLMDVLVDEERGTIFGLVRTVFMLAGATGSAVVGTVADISGWVGAIAIIGVLFGCGAMIIAVGSSHSDAPQ